MVIINLVMNFFMLQNQPQSQLQSYNYLILCLFFSVFIISLQVLLFSPAYASANIHFTDYRILLTEKHRSKNYQIFNQGNSEAYCTTSLVDYHVSDNGHLRIAKQDKPKTSAKEIVRISPKRVVVPAKGSQKVKIVARRLKKQDKQEWVSYLNLRCKTHNPTLKAGINFAPNYVFNIPIVVRHGQLKVSAELKNTEIKQQEQNYFLSTQLHRKGKRSLYGSIEVYDDSGLIGHKRGISHYLQTSALPVNLRLKSKPKGEVRIEFKEDPDFGGDIQLQYRL